MAGRYEEGLGYPPSLGVGTIPYSGFYHYYLTPRFKGDMWWQQATLDKIFFPSGSDLHSCLGNQFFPVFITFFLGSFFFLPFLLFSCCLFFFCFLIIFLYFRFVLCLRNCCSVLPPYYTYYILYTYIT